MTNQIKVFFVFLLLNINQSKAQTAIGLAIGAGVNNIKTNTVYGNQFTKYKGKLSKSIGITVDEKITDWFSIQTGLFYNEKTYQRYRTGYFKENYQNFENGFIQLPITSQFSFGFKKLRGGFIVGATAEYWVKKRTDGQLYNLGDLYLSENTFPKGLMSDESGFTTFNLKIPFDKVTDRRMQAGLIVGTNLQYQLNKIYGISLDYRINHSLTSLVKKYQLGVVPRINETKLLQIGIKRTIN